MYAETGLMIPCLQNFSSDAQQFYDFCHSQKSISSCLDSLIQTSTISDYDLGGDGDLFKAPEPIIEQPLISLDPMTSALSMITSCGEEVKVSDIESLQKEEFLSDVFYECKDIIAKEAGTETESLPLSEVLSFNFPVSNTVVKENVCQIPKSDSLCSMDWIQMKSYLNFNEIDFGSMRRAFSEGDIKSLVQYPHGQPPVLSERTSEERMQKLSRYRNKKTKRNFGRKIKEGFSGQSTKDQRKVCKESDVEEN